MPLASAMRLHETHRSRRLPVLLLLLLCGPLFFIKASPALAFDLKDSHGAATAPQAGASQAAGKESAAPGSAGTQATAPASQDQSIVFNTANDGGAGSAAAGDTGQAGSTTTAPTPLTPRQKFKYSLSSSFKPPTPYALSALSGLFSEATDNDHHRHMTAGDFLADSATHAARSMAFRVTANFFEKFAFAAAFHQDPRYFRSDKHGFARIGYALSRVFITQGDNGHNQFNASFFAGGLVTAGISNVWSRPEDRTVSSTMGRFGLHVAYRGLSNVIHELFGRR